MKMKSGLFGLLFRLRRDERGSILIQATLIVVVIMGMIGLGLDGGRLFMAHNDLQDLADAAALAGAKKLDANAGAMAAATAAANNVGAANNVRWWDVSAAKIQSVQFYKSLADLDANNPAVLDKDAVYIKVTTGAWQIAPTFLAAVGASNNSAQATAVAESGTSLCVPASMMLCNPSDDGTTPNTSSFDAPGPKQVVPGNMFVFS
jgi:Flp pilus assembly protein TadG